MKESGARFKDISGTLQTYLKNLSNADNQLKHEIMDALNIQVTIGSDGVLNLKGEIPVMLQLPSTNSKVLNLLGSS